MSTIKPQENPAGQAAIVHGLRAFKHKNYALFFSGQAISFTGTIIQQVALSWLVYRVTNSPFLLGVTAFASQLPAFIFSPLAGALSDRVDKKKILITVQAVSFIQAALLAIHVSSGNINIAVVIALSALLGVLNGFEITARHSVIPELVKNPGDLNSAIALNSAMFNVARIAGASLAGVIIAFAGEAACFALNALSYIPIIILMTLVRTGGAQQAKKAGVIEDIREGFTHTFSSPVLRPLIAQISFLNFAGLSFGTLLPVFARDVLAGGPKTLGLLTTFVGAGALIGAAFMSARKKVTGILKIMTAATLLFGCAIALFSFSKNIYLSCALIAAAGTGMMMLMASNTTLIQTVVDDRMRGRIISIYMMSYTGFGPLGALALGWLAKTAGAATALAVAGGACLVAALVFSAFTPLLHKNIRAIYVKKGILPAEPQA